MESKKEEINKLYLKFGNYIGHSVSTIMEEQETGSQLFLRFKGTDITKIEREKIVSFLRKNGFIFTTKQLCEVIGRDVSIYSFYFGMLRCTDEIWDYLGYEMFIIRGILEGNVLEEYVNLICGSCINVYTNSSVTVSNYEVHKYIDEKTDNFIITTPYNNDISGIESLYYSIDLSRKFYSNKVLFSETLPLIKNICLNGKKTSNSGSFINNEYYKIKEYIFKKIKKTNNLGQGTIIHEQGLGYKLISFSFLTLMSNSNYDIVNSNHIRDVLLTENPYSMSNKIRHRSRLMNNLADVNANYLRDYILDEQKKGTIDYKFISEMYVDLCIRTVKRRSLEKLSRYSFLNKRFNTLISKKNKNKR